MDGNYGLIGLALMTGLADNPAAPTITLGVKQFLNPMPTYTRTDEAIATGTKFGTQRVVQGEEMGEKTLVARATMRDLPLLLTSCLGTPDGTGLITPREADFAALAPGQPLAVWQKHPLRNMKWRGAQITSLTINFQNRQTADVTVGIMTSNGEKLETLPTFPAIASTGLVKFLNWYLKVDAKTYAPESGSIELRFPMQVEDGARGLDAANRMSPIGVSANGAMTARVAFTLSEVGAGVATGSLATLLDLATPDPATGEPVTKAVETGFEVGGETIKFNFPNAEIAADNIPNGLGRLMIGFSASGVGLGVPPVTATVPVTP